MERNVPVAFGTAKYQLCRKGWGRMGKSKRFLWNFMESDYKAMESYLEDMAAKGWMLRKIRGNFATFDEIPPKNVHFAVNVLEKAGVSFGNPSKDAKAHRRNFEEGGWQYIDGKGYLQFFCSEKEERPLPTNWDLDREKQVLNASLWKKQVAGTLYILVLFSVLMYFLYPVGLEHIQSNTGLVFVGVLPLLLMAGAAHLIYLLLWRHRVKKSVNKGKVFGSLDYRRVRKKWAVIKGAQLLLALMLLIAVAMDLIGGSPTAVILIFTVVINFAFIQIIKTITQEKSDKKSRILLYVALGAGTIAFVAMAYYPGVSFHDRLPEDYARLAEEEWEYMKDLGEKTPQYLRHQSLLLPVSYEAYYYFEKGTFSYAYHQAAHERIAAFIYRDILEDLNASRDSLGGTQTEITELSSDHELYSLWEVDRIAYHEHRNILLLLREDKVLRFQGIPDFSDPDFVDGVNRIFF